MKNNQKKSNNINKKDKKEYFEIISLIQIDGKKRRKIRGDGKC